ncbi:MAG: hypothetical protein AAGB35_08185, partial [Pseudomonadota bacterium]
PGKSTIDDIRLKIGFYYSHKSYEPTPNTPTDILSYGQYNLAFALDNEVLLYSCIYMPREIECGNMGC